MTLLDKFIDKALKDQYLFNMLEKLEKNYANYFFENQDAIECLTDKEYFDLLRFSDILCRSDNPDARNISYKIISLLYEFYKEDSSFKLFSSNVLTKLGNFPSLVIAVGSTEVNSDEIMIDRIVKEVYQQAPDSDLVFTDTQYQLFERMKDSNHFSFSGPTSFGKSFIFESFVKYLIEKRNGSDNIVILVPTRALINQVSSKLKKVITNEKYKIFTHPTVPLIYRREENKFIFVFTPERLVAYLSEVSNPVINYLLVDEAHKLLSETDTRAPLFYHALMLAKRKSINLYFSSPNIPNVDIFLQLVGNSTEETMSITETSVSQNRFFIDCIENRACFFPEYGRDETLVYKGFGSSLTANLNNALAILGKQNQNIIYCNTKEDTINYALEYSKSKQNKDDKELNNLIKLIEETMHEEYYLIDCLKKGIAYHFGGLPQQIREVIEILFQKKVIDYIFCTSTLLEGVNLPAKNIFILSNAIGLSKFSKIDFWNLAGRAGRLTKDLSGNIICLRLEEKKNRWNDPQKNLDIVRNKKIDKVNSILMTNKGKFYTNVGNTIKDKPFTRSKVTENERRILESYGNVLAYHSISKTDSVLRSKFIDKNSESKEIIDYIDKNNFVPESILVQSSSIKLKYQNRILSDNREIKVPLTTEYSDCLSILNSLYDNYDWEKEESKGRTPLVKNKTVLTYYADLMYAWINSQPLNIIIQRAINYYDRYNRSIYLNYGEEVLFDKYNRQHINHLINNVMFDVENTLRFKIKTYVKNYIDLISYKNNEMELNSEIPKWDDFLEYGTTNKIIIELQNIGFPRHIASFLKKEYLDYFVIENGIIVDFYDEELRMKLKESDFKQEYKEICEIFGWE